MDLKQIEALKKENITADESLHDAGYNGAINEVLSLIRRGGNGERTNPLMWPDAHFIIKYMVEHVNTERLTSDDTYELEKLTDRVFSDYMEWKNKRV